MNREETYKMLGEYVDFLLEKSDAEHPYWNIENIREGKPNKWNYIDGCMITAVLSLYGSNQIHLASGGCKGSVRS